MAGLSKNVNDREQFKFGFANAQTHTSVSDTGFILKSGFNTILEKLLDGTDFDSMSSTFTENLTNNTATEVMVFKSGLTTVATVTVLFNSYGNYTISVTGVVGIDFLLQENGDNLLLENGSNLIL